MAGKYYCIDCGKEIYCHTALYGSKRCRSCATKNAYKTNKRKSRKPSYCMDCGKQLSSCRAKRCSVCAKLKHGRYSKGYQNYCIDCKKEINPNAIKCQECFYKFNRGKNHPFFGKHHTVQIIKIIRKNTKRAMTKEVLKKIKLKLKLFYANPKNHGSNWQGGITSLHDMIRHTKKYRECRLNIFERDNYTCQECGQIGGQLEAHHKKSFSQIYAEFLKEYDQFSPIEDKETLVRLAMKYKPFWEITNGQTLCKDCHKLTDSYLKNKKRV